MLGADTDVLVRFLTRDDDEQAPLAFGFISEPANQPIHLCTVVVIELVWVLIRVKHWPQRRVFDACRALLDGENFLVEDRELILAALDDAEAAHCDLADAVIARVNERAGCAATGTFDRAAQRLTRMASVEARP